MENTEATKTRYLSCTDWCKEHSWPPLGGLRHLIFHAATNGFQKVIRRCGRRVLINEHEFFRWIEEINGNIKQPTTTSNNKKML